jgi:hypothetical protein
MIHTNDNDLVEAAQHKASFAEQLLWLLLLDIIYVAVGPNQGYAGWSPGTGVTLVTRINYFSTVEKCFVRF